MAKIWYSSKELVSIEGLPSTIQGVNRKARMECWKSRKRTGVQGKAIEYHIDSLPDVVKLNLTHAREYPAPYNMSLAEPIQLWISAFSLLNHDEKELVTTWLMRNGIKELIKFVQQQDNIID